MTKPSNADLDAIKDKLFLFQDPATTKLTLPNHDSSLDATFGSLTTDDRFSDLAFAIIPFDPVATVDSVFLHRPDESWDIGSGGKLSILTAAVALMIDLRALQSAGLVSESNADGLMQYVWTRHNDAAIKQLSTEGRYPLPSVMFDFSGGSVKFKGPEPDFSTLRHKDLVATTFRERLHQAIGHSDNKAARACQGALGIGFINAVLRKLGLFDVEKGEGIRIAGPYSPNHPDLPKGWRQPVGIPWARGRQLDPHALVSTPYVATARTLTALLVAIVKRRFFNDDARDTMLWFLKFRPEFSYSSWALIGINQQLAADGYTIDRTIDQEYTKIGIWMAGEEFVYVLYRKNRLPYGLIILGEVDKRVGGTNIIWQDRASLLAKEVQKSMALI